MKSWNYVILCSCSKQNYKCEEYAKEFTELLEKQNIDYEVVKLESKFGIYSDKLGKTISEGSPSTGGSYHFGVKVGDTVFDNNYPAGIKYSDWITDLGANSADINIITDAILP